MKLAIMGTPGVGKTTLALALAERLGIEYIGSGDIARAIDPNTQATGAMAAEEPFRVAILQALAGKPNFVLDGLPRTKGQADYLPAGTVSIMLTCREDIARDRLLRRSATDGRPDGTPESIKARIAEQTALLELEDSAGWAWRYVGYGRAVATSQKKPKQILDGVLAYLEGKKRECY